MRTGKQWLGLMLLCTSAVTLSASALAAEKKLKVFISFGLYGNTWMEQNRNMMTALSKSRDYKDKMDLKVQVVGNGDPQRQSQQINGMIEAGADVIVLYPSSPTGLNRAIKNACRRGISVITWDATVTEKCATNIHADNAEQARAQAKWVAERTGGKGNVLMIHGMNGVAASDDRVRAAKKFWSEKYPGIKVAGEVEGKWSDPVVREQLSKFMAVRRWSDIDVVYAQLGCYPVYAMQDEAGIADKDKVPCAGSVENAELLALLPAGSLKEKTSGSYRPMGIDGYTYSIGPVLGALALKYGVDARLEDRSLPHDILYHPEEITAENVKLCKEGTFKEMADGCNTFSPAMMPNPETSAGIYSKELPQLGLDAALNGNPEY